MTTPVPVLLDLREYKDVPAAPKLYVALWERLEPALFGVDPRESRTLRLGDGERGVLGIRFLDPEANPAVLDGSTAFAIRGVLEPPKVHYACESCRSAGELVYGPFQCHLCKDGGRERRLCDRHATVFDGAFRVMCPDHVPRCAGGDRCSRATFWCDGRTCRRGTAWCENHRRRHPGDGRTSYCPDCFTDKFPPCIGHGCRQTGHVRCEYTRTRDGETCRNRACAQHAYRWQIYGPHRRGLGLCPEHRGALSALSREDLVFQIVAGTAARRRVTRQRSVSPQLPRLTIVRHIFIHVRGEALDMKVIGACFTGVRYALGSGQREEAMRQLLDADAAAREAAIKQDDDTQQVGQRHFEALRRLLVADGKAELAARITYSDFRAGILRVRVPPELTGLFIGRGGAGINGLSGRLGVVVKVEQR